ncbi:MAG: hypothetical protein PHP42_03315 [Bacteroidota bacterium]|nr:hypothetical protein [Bacteroidota bacterium]
MKSGLVFMVLLCVMVVTAQEKKEAAQKDVDVKKEVQPPKENAPLPKIDVPEFVITGNEKIDLNIQSKTEDDEERYFVPDKPSVGVRSAAADGAISPKQTKSFSRTPTAMNGKVFAGYGFYLTPQFDGWFGQHDQSNSFILNGYYTSTEGHEKNADGWKGGFGGRGRYVLPESSTVLPYAQLNGDVQYDRQSYRAYGSLSPTRTRDLSTFDLSFGIGSRYALPYHSLSGLDYTGTIGLENFAANDSLRSSESDLYFNTVASTRFVDMALRGQLEYRTTSYTMYLPGLQSGQWFILKADGLTSLLPSLQCAFALEQFFYRGNFGVTSGRLYPQVELRYFMTDNASLYAGFSPNVERNTLSSLIKQNRYINFNAFVAPSDVKVQVQAGMEYTPIEELTANAKFSYKNINNYPTFLDSTDAKVWEVTYLSNVRSTRIDFSILYRLDRNKNVTAYFSAQQVVQRDSLGTLPYIPKYSFGTVYHHYFDFGLHVEGLAEYIASRYTNFSNTHTTAGYVYTSVKADIELFEHFRGYAEIQNLINQHYYIWNGYRERSMYLLLGVSYNW